MWLLWPCPLKQIIGSTSMLLGWWPTASSPSASSPMSWVDHIPFLREAFLGRECRYRRLENPGIAKIGLTPPPFTPNPDDKRGTSTHFLKVTDHYLTWVTDHSGELWWGFWDTSTNPPKILARVRPPPPFWQCQDFQGVCSGIPSLSVESISESYWYL